MSELHRSLEGSEAANVPDAVRASVLTTLLSGMIALCALGLAGCLAPTTIELEWAPDVPRANVSRLTIAIVQSCSGFNGTLDRATTIRSTTLGPRDSADVFEDIEPGDYGVAVIAEGADACGPIAVGCDNHTIDQSGGVVTVQVGRVEQCGAGQSCIAGACVATGECNDSALDCDGQPGCEALIESDAKNCGGCGIQCGLRCSSRACVAPALVASGRAHTCAVDAVGVVLCWGDGTQGALGGMSSPVPVRIDVPAPVSEIYSGDDHVCAVISDGTMYCWGSNTRGQILGAPMGMVTQPVELPISMQSGGKLALGAGHSCMLSGGEVSCWGAFERNQTTSGDVLRVTVALAEPATDIDAGGDHTCAILMSGGVQCWGDNEDSASGAPPGMNPAAPSMVQDVTGAKSIAVGRLHGCALTGDDLVLCWGSNRQQQVAVTDVGGIDEYTTRPFAPSGDDTFTQVFANGDFTCAQKSEQLFCWGSNMNDQLGPSGGLSARSLVPVTLGAAPAGSRVSLGQSHGCVVQLDDRILCWGANSSGQLGDGMMTPSRAEPMPIQP